MELTQRLVIRKPIDRKEIKRMAYRAGWDLLAVVEEDHVNETPYEVSWETAASDALIRYIEDQVLDLRYLLVKSANATVFTEVIEIIHDKLPIFTHAQIEDLVESAQNPEELIAFLFVAAAAAPQKKDRRFWDLFQKGLTHSKPQVREATVFAAGYPAWPEFYDNFKIMKDADPNAEVRETARLWLQGYESQ